MAIKPPLVALPAARVAKAVARVATPAVARGALILGHPCHGSIGSTTQAHGGHAVRCPSRPARGAARSTSMSRWSGSATSETGAMHVCTAYQCERLLNARQRRGALLPLFLWC